MIDVRVFAENSAIDTCAVWNVLSSSRLMAAARARQCWFLVPQYVRYEALERSRSAPAPSELMLQSAFRERLDRQDGFSLQSVSLEDLLAVAGTEDTRKLGQGEIATLALARRMRIAILTDDQEARGKAAAVGVQPAQTTPHLLGWLVYEGDLSDGDFRTVVAEHEVSVPMRKGRLTRFFQAAYEEACRCRFVRDRGMEATETPAAAK